VLLTKFRGVYSAGQLSDLCLGGSEMSDVL